jgi:hypothetical protein
VPIELLSPMTSLDAALDRQNRLHVRRSSAFREIEADQGDLTNRQLAAMINQPLRAAAEQALRSNTLESTCPGTAELAVLAAELSKFLAITAGNWTAGQKDDWVAAVLEVLADLPFLLTKPQIIYAKTHVEYPGKFLVWMTGEIDASMKRLSTERRVVERMIAIYDAGLPEKAVRG